MRAHPILASLRFINPLRGFLSYAKFINEYSIFYVCYIDCNLILLVDPFGVVVYVAHRYNGVNRTLKNADAFLMRAHPILASLPT